MKALVSELKVLIHLGQHLNIVNLLGACTTDIRKGKEIMCTCRCSVGKSYRYEILWRAK